MKNMANCNFVVSILGMMIGPADELNIRTRGRPDNGVR